MILGNSPKTEGARMQLGETIATYDVALALRGENGKFDVTSPSGDVFQVTCTPNHARDANRIPSLF